MGALADQEADPEELRAPGSRRRFAAFRLRWQRLRGRLDPDAQPVRSGSMVRWGRFARAWVLPWWRRILVLVVLGVVTAVVDLTTPLLTGRMLDLATGSRPPPAWLAGHSIPVLILLTALAALACLLVARLIALAAGFLQRSINQRVELRLKRAVWARILRLPLRDLQDLKTGGAASRINQDAAGAVQFLENGVLDPALAILRLLLVLGCMLWLSWPVALAAMVVLLIAALTFNRHISVIMPVHRSMGQDRQRVEARISEALQGIRIVRSFAREWREEAVHAVGQHTLARKWMFAMGIHDLIRLTWMIMLPASAVVCVGVGAWMLQRGELTAGGVLAFNMLVMQAVQPMMIIIHSIAETQRSLVAAERVYAVLDSTPEKPDRADAVALPPSGAGLRLAGVTFAYGCEAAEPGGTADRAGKTVVLDGIDLDLSPGSVTAVVGPSGAGKSTLADLVARFHDPSAGAVLLGGIDVRNLRLAEYRQLFGVVQQDVFLFDGTVAENLRYARPEASDAAVAEAARRAHALGFISELPQGFATVIGERGAKLSGGQRQRLSIARAILADPRFLILDEATASLDSASEQEIQAALADFLRDGRRTTLVIAHRLSTVRHADHIVVLERGRIVERGDHASLMARGGVYAGMVRRQELTVQHGDDGGPTG